MTEFMQRKNEQPIALKIASIKDEAEDIRTFTFNHEMDALPGQFVMLWIPRKNMKPFGVSYQDKDKFSVTVCKVGEFTEELFKKKVGDYIGIQGPYGRAFSTDKKNVIMVAGGYGAAPLGFLAEYMAEQGAKVHLIIGARTNDMLVYKDRFKDSDVEIIYCTDDGTCGIKGFTTQPLKELLDDEKDIDMVYTVGPEVMMKKVIEITDEHDVDCEASLERYMKCGFGICGQCCVDGSGERVCKTGPIYDKGYIKKYISEFGKYHRDGTGNIIK